MKHYRLIENARRYDTVTREMRLMDIEHYRMNSKLEAAEFILKGRAMGFCKGTFRIIEVKHD